MRSFSEHQPGEDAALAIADAIRGTREYQAGAAFGVPLDARDSHAAAMADAAMECMSAALDEVEIARRAAKLALGVAFFIAVVAAVRR